MTVPIFTDFLTDEDVGPGESLTSLCYEVHGEADGVFNLVSDTCVTVNGHYAKAPINSSNIDLNIVDAIGVRAVSDGGTCENIRVGQQGCQATVNGVDINGMYRRDGISVREYANRVRIVVPNCANIDLVMWVFCMNGQTEDSVTEEIFNFNFIRFVVRRGLNLAEESHGLIGKVFLNNYELVQYILCLSHTNFYPFFQVNSGMFPSTLRNIQEILVVLNVMIVTPSLLIIQGVTQEVSLAYCGQ